MTSGLMKVVSFIMQFIESIWRFVDIFGLGSNNNLEDGIQSNNLKDEIQSNNLEDGIEINNLENGIQINLELCKRLEWKIGKSRRLIKRQGVYLSERRAMIVYLLKVAMNQGEDLLRQCKCEGTRSWLYSAVTLMNITEEVLEIEFELGLLAALLNVVSELDGFIKDGGTALLDAVCEKLSKGSEYLHEAAAEDAGSLESKLKDEMHMHAQGTEEYVLAVYLLTRLKHGRGDCGIPVEDIDLLDTHFQKALEIQECLGRGANGAVYAATWLNSHKWAVKVLFGANQRRPEATFLQSCNHPNIIRYIWSWQQDSDHRGKRVPHILMEGMHMDLETLIAQKRDCNPDMPPFELSEAIDLMLQITKAVRYLHGNKVYIDGRKSKITHRDLKPKNILVDVDDEGKWKVKLADFGISKVYQGTETSTPLTFRQGTNVYTAPEVWLKEDGEKFRFPPKADVWSFAMTCSEILSGDPPFLGVPRVDLHVKIKEEGLRPRLPNNLPSAFRSYIAQCWDLDPKKRPNFEEICKTLAYFRNLSLDILRNSQE